MKRKTNLGKALNNFLTLNEKMAKKYGCTISMSVIGPDGVKSDEVILADHKKKPDNLTTE